MTLEHLQTHFAKIGARVKFRGLDRALRFQNEPPSDSFAIDVRSDRRGEYFDISRGEDAPEFDLLQAVPGDRHLLLYARDGQRFLCGHDERHWFVAAVESRVSTVRAAKQSLQPAMVRSKAARFAPSVTEKRRNLVFKRQGEWFFVPMRAQFRVHEHLILQNEPLSRNAQSKPHICEELHRRGGRPVYVFAGKTWEKSEFEKMRRKNPRFGRDARSWRADPRVYVRGRVCHADHTTITLEGWHRVYINGEVSTSSVTFLD